MWCTTDSDHNARPDLVTNVPVKGRMPDIDRPEDIARMGEAPT